MSYMTPDSFLLHHSSRNLEYVVTLYLTCVVLMVKGYMHQLSLSRAVVLLRNKVGGPTKISESYIGRPQGGSVNKSTQVST